MAEILGKSHANMARYINTFIGRHINCLSLVDNSRNRKSKEKMKASKGIFRGCIISIIIWMVVILILSSCTTIRNAERRHDRIVNNFPFVHQIDTVEIVQDVEVVVPEIKGGDTLYFTTNSVDTIVDTIYVDKIRIIHKILTNPSGGARLETHVLKPSETTTKTVKVKYPTITNKPIKWHEKHTERLFVLAFVLGSIAGVVLMMKKDRNE